jgi:RHS repeat-associated protein
VDVTDYADIEPIINGATKIYNYSDGTSVEELYWDDTFEVLKSETFKENGVTTAVYSYDNQGVLTSLTEYEGDDVILTSYTYSNGNLTSATTTKNNVETAYEEYDYDSDGNQISSAIRKNGKTITTSCTYANGKLVSSTDPRDNTSTISYANGLLQTMTNANGIATRYTYANNRITSYYLDEDMNEAFTQGEKRIQYYYDTYGRISYYMTGAGNYYGYSYNSAGLLSSVNLANRTLITFEYNSAYTQLIGYSYGSVVKTYEYDIYGNLITIKHNFSPRYTFKYNCLGLLESVTDAETGIVRHYSYDIDGNQWNYYESGANYNYSLGEVEVNDVSTLMYSIDGNDYSCYNDYDDTTNTNSYVLPSGASISGESDDFGRSSSTVISDADGNALVEYDIGYEEWTDGNNVLRTSELVSSFDVNGKTYTYTYDANCNITSVSIDGVLADTYTYDAAGQLIRDDSAAQDKTITYTYNNSGNVSIIKEYAYTLGNLGSVLSTRSFGYNAAIDTMFNYNGITVNYDSSGNPLNWRDGMTFTWEGRELKTATANGKTYQYYYNSDGIRTRTIEKNGILHYYHDYILDGTKILAEKIYTVIQGNVLPATTKIYVYLYDGNDSPIGIKHGNDYYYFTKNLQGDITGIVDSSGTSVVEYTYDVWGSILSASGSLASTLGVINIFRYRGYVYDTATKLYYLQSRYYDPDCGRFLNPDDTQYLGASGTVLGWNLYSYCENNAVNSIDPKGRDAVLLIQTGGAYGFGHAGLLIEKNNEWYYFSVSGKQQNHSMLIDYHYLGQGKSITRRILNGGVTFVNSLINKVAKSSPQQRFYREVYIAGVYNHMHYFTGSFYLSLEESKRVYRRHDKYNVFSNNCLTVAVELLQKGKCTGPLANEYNTAIKLLSYLYIPNDAEFALSYFESTINAYLIAQKGNWLTRLIFYLRYKDPYYYFTHPVSSSLY